MFLIVKYELYTVQYGYLIFVEIKFLWISLGFISTIINEVSYIWCLRYNICSAWFLDIVHPDMWIFCTVSRYT